MVSPLYRLLMYLSDGKSRTFSEIVKDTGLSRSTISKWLKILQAMGAVTKVERTYRITDLGIRILEAINTDILSMILEAGIAKEMVLYLDTNLGVDVEDGEFVFIGTHYGNNSGEIRVKINMGDDVEGIKKMLERLMKEVNRLASKEG